MGRHFEFNREETLTKAMEVFWQKGYKATSIKDITAHTGLKPGSIYNTFGDKHSLFIEAIEHYGEVVTSNILKTLSAGGSPSENIKKFFTDLVSRPMDKQCKGCLIVNTVVELANHDGESTKVVKNIISKIEEAFYNSLKKAQELGEISSETDIEALASYYASSTHGLLVTGKAAATRKQMENIVDVILTALR